MGREKFRNVDPREFTAYGLPLGRLIESASKLSQDDSTRLGVEHAKKILQNEGLVLLDYHRSLIDIVAVSAVAVNNLPLQLLLGPVAGKYLDKKIINHLLKRMEKVQGLELYPVYRSEEKEIGALLTMGNMDYMSRLNTDYMERVKHIIETPYSAAMIAPFGTRKKTEGMKVRKGVVELLKTGCPAICTYANVRKSPKPFNVLFSDRILRFNGNITQESATREISDEFAKLQKRA